MMQDQYLTLKTYAEKTKYLAQVRGPLDKAQLLQLYRNIMDDKNTIEEQNTAKEVDSSFYCLLYAMENNVGGIFPSDRTRQIDKAAVEGILMVCTDCAHYGLYCRFIKCHFDAMDNANSSECKALMKLIGEYVDKQIIKSRKEGRLQQAVYIRNSHDPSKLAIDRQNAVVDMIIALTPLHLQLNPELFPIVLQVFSSGISPDNYNSLQLEQLAKVIKDQCTYEDNMNNDHDWMMLLSALFEQGYRNEGVGMLYILRHIEPEILCQIILTNWKYLILNYFNNADSTVQIFNGMTKYYITQTNLEIILQISRLLYTQVQKGSELHLQILREVFQRFILTKILNQIQMFGVLKENLELLEFYMVGLCKIEGKLPEGTFELMSKRLRMLLSLRFQSRDFTRPVYQFIETIKYFYKDQAKNPELTAIQRMCQEKSSYPLTASNIQQKQSLIWQVDMKALKGTQQSFQLLSKDSSQYVGLENLGNTCFMNSFIQCLFMNQQFRELILKLKFIMDPSVFFSDKQSMISSLQKVFMLLTYQKQGFCSPYVLKRQIREPYGGAFEQQDVGEFGLHFLEDVHQLIQELTKNNERLQPLLDDLQNLFVGTLQSILKCALCGAVSKSQQEKFMGLALHFRHKSRESIMLNKDLKNMIREFFDPEDLEFTCQSCNKRSERSKKQAKLITLPPCLMFTLQRFTYDVVEQRKTKMLEKVLMEFEIDMSEVFTNIHVPDQDSFKYELYAFIVHLGNSSDSGHYITYARQIDKDKENWITFDDSFITSQVVKDAEFFDQQLIAQETPYLLFYRNKSLKPCDFTKLQ